MPIPSKQGKYETPYVSGINDTGDNTEEIGRFMARTLKLPANVQNIFRNFSTAEFIEEKLGQTFGLSAEQKTELTRIIRDILLADAFLGDLLSLISSKLGIEMSTASQIAGKTLNELFAPAIENIKNMQREKFKDRIAQARDSQTQQSPPPEAPPAQPPRPAGFVKPSERVRERNVIDLRNRGNNQ